MALQRIDTPTFHVTLLKARLSVNKAMPMKATKTNAHKRTMFHSNVTSASPW